jgi:hypothetical protein
MLDFSETSSMLVEKAKEIAGNTKDKLKKHSVTIKYFYKYFIYV